MCPAGPGMSADAQTRVNWLKTPIPCARGGCRPEKWCDYCVTLDALRERLTEYEQRDDWKAWHDLQLRVQQLEDALRGLVEHIDLNGGCHKGCPEHDAARAALGESGGSE